MSRTVRDLPAVFAEAEDQYRASIVVVRTAVQAARHLATVRKALPRWMQVLMGVALVCTCLPGVPDFGLDESIYVMVGLVLWFRHRMLVRAVWHAAQMEVTQCGSAR